MSGFQQTLETKSLSHPFDVAALDAFLSQHIRNYRGPLSIEPLTGGQSNPTFRIDAGDRRFVLRKKPQGALLPSAHAVDREYRVVKALQGSKLSGRHSM
jgi:aminoglycoside phosphotransferase (APT) family kinase protein